MKKVTSHTGVVFPKLKWAISAGDKKELPKDKDAQERILAEPNIRPIEEEEKVEGKITTNKK